VKSVLLKWMVCGIRLFVPSNIRRLLCSLLFSAAAISPSAKHGLGELVLEHDDLCSRLDECAIRYEGGLHPKHRLTAYHRFFTERIRKGETVLDVGCGVGAVAFSLAEAGAVVTGIDQDEQNIRTACERHAHRNIVYVHGDATRALPSGSFEAIVLSNVLEHISERTAFLRQLQKNLNPRRMLIRVPLLERDWLVPLKRELGLPFFSDPTHCTEYTKDSFADEIKAAGLEMRLLEVRWGEIWAEVGSNAAR
jgi:SAM-dependent methyltransferase